MHSDVNLNFHIQVISFSEFLEFLIALLFVCGSIEVQRHVVCT
jgi:hypothetical protein